MIFLGALVVSFAAVGLSNPVVLRSNSDGPPANSTYVQCVEGGTDPICQALRRPIRDVISEIVHPNGTVETKRNLYTREQLKEIRDAHVVISTEHRPGDVVQDQSAQFIANLTKRESAPPVCYTETQRWYDTNEWGYWYQNWHQVGNCFYCDSCTESIAQSFGVTETWTVGLSYEFGKVLTATFQFSWGQTFTVTDTRTCQWNNVESGCHSIWYQPLMSYHNGYANYQTHTHCGPGQGQAAKDSYYDHNWAFANVNAGGDKGINQGNLGCNSGCQGSDHRQCQYGNNGGVLWPNAN